MTVEELDEIFAENANLRESIRILEHRNAELSAQILAMREAPSQRPTDQSRWIGYKGGQETLRGAFDMLMVSGWKSRLVRMKWETVVYAGSGVHELDDAASKEFWTKFETYLNRE